MKRFPVTLRRLSLKTFFISAILALAATAPTLADERIIVTYTGTVSDLYDPDNLFGYGDFTDVFEFDINSKYRSQLLPDLDEIIGGPQFGISSPALSSELTIGTTTIDFPTDLLGQDFNEMGMQILSNVAGSFRDGMVGENEVSLETNAPEFVTTPYSGDGSPGEVGLFLICDGSGYECSRVVASGTLSASMVTSATALPEPSEWALLIAGFGGIAIAMRARQRVRN